MHGTEAEYRDDLGEMDVIGERPLAACRRTVSFGARTR